MAQQIKGRGRTTAITSVMFAYVFFGFLLLLVLLGVRGAWESLTDNVPPTAIERASALRTLAVVGILFCVNIFIQALARSQPLKMDKESKHETASHKDSEDDQTQ